MGNVVIALTGALMYGMLFVIMLYMQHVRGYDPLTTGLVHLPVPMVILAGTQLAPRLAVRFGPHNALLLEFMAQAAGLAWWAGRIGTADDAVLDFLAPAVLATPATPAYLAGYGWALWALFGVGVTAALLTRVLQPGVPRA